MVHHAPVTCQQGTDEAQSNAAWANFLMYMLTLILHPVPGSVSDTRGRRPILILCLFLSCITQPDLVLHCSKPFGFCQFSQLCFYHVVRCDSRRVSSTSFWNFVGATASSPAVCTDTLNTIARQSERFVSAAPGWNESPHRQPQW